jgi:hypothetical protein
MNLCPFCNNQSIEPSGHITCEWLSRAQKAEAELEDMKQKYESAEHDMLHYLSSYSYVRGCLLALGCKKVKDKFGYIWEEPCEGGFKPISPLLNEEENE